MKQNYNTETKYSRPAETALFFQISQMTLHRWRQKSDFPQPLKVGATVLYQPKEIERWLEQQTARKNNLKK